MPTNLTSYSFLKKLYEAIAADDSNKLDMLSKSAPGLFKHVKIEAINNIPLSDYLIDEGKVNCLKYLLQKHYFPLDKTLLQKAADSNAEIAKLVMDCYVDYYAIKNPESHERPVKLEVLGKELLQKFSWSPRNLGVLYFNMLNSKWRTFTGFLNDPNVLEFIAKTGGRIADFLTGTPTPARRLSELKYFQKEGLLQDLQWDAKSLGEIYCSLNDH